MKTRGRARRSNMRKLREASRIAMAWPVLVMADVDELMTLSLAPWHSKDKAEAMRKRYLELGVFSAMPGEKRYAVFLRMWEEAAYSGALLGDVPGEKWVCENSARGRPRTRHGRVAA